MNQPLSVYELIANASKRFKGHGVVGDRVRRQPAMILQRWSCCAEPSRKSTVSKIILVWHRFAVFVHELSEEEQLSVSKELRCRLSRIHRLSEQQGVAADAIMQGVQRAMRVVNA